MQTTGWLGLGKPVQLRLPLENRGISLETEQIQDFETFIFTHLEKC